MSDALRIDFEVVCPIHDAFEIWTERIGTWWPPDHTISGDPAAVVLEGRVGGRIYERTQQGEELDWGAVTGWRPPDQLSYRWHLGVEPEAATEVEIRFIALDGVTTRVEIVQSGWERLGEVGPELQRRNHVGWESLVPQVRAAMEREG
ncbi:MAG TPA: SRPBCC domain-containing protein [Acidimicrobiales bacterium]